MAISGSGVVRHSDDSTRAYWQSGNNRSNPYTVYGTTPFGTQSPFGDSSSVGISREEIANATPKEAGSFFDKIRYYLSHPEEIADYIDTLSGGKLEYERTLALEQMARDWNSEEAQVTRMLAAGLNPYMNGVASSTSSAPTAPSAAGVGALTDVGKLGQALMADVWNGLRAIPRDYMEMKESKEDIISKKLDNVFKGEKHQVDMEKTRHEIQKLQHENYEAEQDHERNKRKFEWQKEEVERVREEHVKKMRSFDDEHTRNMDEHEKNVYAITRRGIQETLDDLQIRAMNDAHDSAEYERNVMRGLERAYLVAQTNSIINNDARDATELEYKKLDLDQRLRIGEFQEQLLDGQMTEQDYINKLHEYGVTVHDSVGTQQAAIADDPHAARRRAWSNKFSGTVVNTLSSVAGATAGALAGSRAGSASSGAGPYTMSVPIY